MRRWLLLAALLVAPVASASDLETLLAEDRLRIRSWLEPADDVVQGQEVRLLIEVSTPRWFAGGTGIKPPEVPQLLFLRRNEFAVNLSRREAGATWVIQRWQLELYPQRAGEFVVPPVALTLAVNDADLGIVRGTVATEMLGFTASVPPELAGVSRWLATPSFTVRQSFDRALEGLAPGDAFQRTIELEATRLTALMLPEPRIEELDGLAAYPDLPELEDRSNRGEATALRRQIATYVVEKPGQYELPEQTLTWWNTDTGRVETAILPAVSIDAGVAAGEARSAFTPPTWWPQMMATVAATLLLVLLFRRQRRGENPLRTARRALRKGDAPAASRALYQWLNLRQGKPGWLSLRESSKEAESAEQLLAAAYGRSPGPAPDTGLVQRLLAPRDERGAAATPTLNPRQPRK